MWPSQQMSTPTSIPSALTAPATPPPVVHPIEWLDEAGYDVHVRQRPNVLKLAVLDPNNVWPYLESTFSSYQPFQGLQIKNKTGSLQKVEDLYADVVQMHFKEGATAGPGALTGSRGRALTTTSAAVSVSRSKFGFGPAALTSVDDSATKSNKPQSLSSTPSGGVSLKHPMYWHAYPYLHVFICTCVSVDEYTKSVKPQIKRFMEYFVQPQLLQGNGAATPSSNPFTPRTPAHATAAPSTAPNGAPELRYHSEVLILYAPLLEDSPIQSGLAASLSAMGGGITSLFKKSSSFSTASTASHSPVTSSPTISGTNTPTTPMSIGSSSSVSHEHRADQLKAARRVYDKLKADFGGSKDPNASQTARIDLFEMIKHTSGPTAGDASPSVLDSDVVHQWDDFIAKIVRSLIRTHEHRALLYESELKATAQNSSMSGWNFLGWCVVKESYAKLHQQMGLKSDALRLYEELLSMMEELQNTSASTGQPVQGGEQNRLQVLLEHTRQQYRSTLPAPQSVLSPSDTASVSPPPTTPSSLPGPILDVWRMDYPLAILRGEVGELEIQRYLTAQALWTMIKMNRAPSGALSNVSNHYLVEVMRRGAEMIQKIVRRVGTKPFDSLSPSPSTSSLSFPTLFTWSLEAVMDLGLLCEKYLIQNYVATYQNLTVKIVAQQQAAAAAAQNTSSGGPVTVKEKSAAASFTGALANAITSVIGPSSSGAATPAATPASSSSSSLPSSSLHSATKSLKSSHESDLKLLQNVRGDLYGWLLEKLMEFGRASPVYRLKGEIREVLNAEQQERLNGVPASGVRKTPLVRYNTGAESTTPSQSGSFSTPLSSPHAAAGGQTSLAGSAPAVRIGLDDDVYADMMEEYYPYEHKLNSTSESTVDEESPDSSTAISTPPYQLFHARHRRILECFDAVTNATVDPETVTSSGGTFLDLFLELCTCCLRMYWLSGRYRLCTRVAEMKACVYYSAGEYTKALDLFLTNCQRWRQDRWTQLYYPSLIMSIKSQQRLSRHEEVVRSCLLFLLTAHQHLTSSRFRPVLQHAQAGLWPKLTGSENLKDTVSQGRFVWSRLAAMVEGTKQAKSRDAGKLKALDISEKSAEVKKKLPGESPLILYEFPAIAEKNTLSGAPSPSITAPTSSPCIQLLQLVSVEEASSEIPPASDESTDHVPDDCSTFLLDCCPTHRSSLTSPSGLMSPKSSAMYENGMVSPAHVQQLLEHTLRVHMPRANASSDLDWFNAVRILAERNKSLQPLFAEQNSSAINGGSVPMSPTASKKSKKANNGTALSCTPIVIKTTSTGTGKDGVTSDGREGDLTVVNAEPPLSPSSLLPLPCSLPPGPYIESTLHPFFLFKAIDLTVYRKTHPLHAVLEVDLESRWPKECVVERIVFVIGLERKIAAAEEEEEGHSRNDRASKLKRRPRRQISVVVTSPPPPAYLAGSQSHVRDIIGRANIPLPSPLPSQSLSKSNSLDHLSVSVVRQPDPSAEPLSSDGGLDVSVGGMEITPDPSPMPAVKISEAETSVLDEPSVRPASESAFETPSAKSETSSWTCIFHRVTLHPGTNKLYFHVFHTTMSSEGEQQSEQTHQEQAEAMHEHASSSPSSLHHYSVVLSHSFSDLEALHAMFEPSHAHQRDNQQGMEQSRRKSSAGDASTAATFHVPRLSSSAAAIHSHWSTTLSLDHILFSFGERLLL